MQRMSLLHSTISVKALNGSGRTSSSLYPQLDPDGRGVAPFTLTMLSMVDVTWLVMHTITTTTTTHSSMSVPTETLFTEHAI